MTKKGQIQKMARDAGISYRAAELAYVSLVGSAAEALSAGGKFRLVGVGTMEVKNYPARGGFNPRTKKLISIPERNSVIFRASAALKRLVS